MLGSVASSQIAQLLSVCKAAVTACHTHWFFMNTGLERLFGRKGYLEEKITDLMFESISLLAFSLLAQNT